MTPMNLMARFSDFKKSDKIAMMDFERKAPGEFRLKLMEYVTSANVSSDTESYRLQMLGEFIGEMLPSDRADTLQRVLSEGEWRKEAATPIAVTQFEAGFAIGREAKGLATARKEPYRQIVVYPE